MALKNWLGRRGKERDETDFEIDDLVAEGRLHDAIELLRDKLRVAGHDLHLRQKLAEVLIRAKRGGEAVDEYIEVADGYARDGFYDKALALLAKVVRLVPADEKVTLKMEALRRAKKLERRRTLVIDSLLQSGGQRQRAGTSAFEVQRLWMNLTESPLVEELNEDHLKRVFGAMELVHLGEGELLAPRHADLEEIFLVARGGLEVTLELDEGKPTVLRTFEPGQLVGDRALLEHQRWPATYRSTARSTLLRLNRAGLERALTGCADPKSLLDALRGQRNDHQVAQAVERLGES